MKNSCSFPGYQAKSLCHLGPPRECQQAVLLHPVMAVRRPSKTTAPEEAKYQHWHVIQVRCELKLFVAVFPINNPYLYWIILSMVLRNFRKMSRNNSELQPDDWTCGSCYICSPDVELTNVRVLSKLLCQAERQTYLCVFPTIRVCLDYKHPFNCFLH